MQAEDISGYITERKDELFRLFPNRYVCFIKDSKGGVKIDASYDDFMQGVTRSDMRYGRGNYLLFHVSAKYIFE